MKGGQARARAKKRGGAATEPQQERSAETRQRLLEATIQCLSQYGYAETTTALVAQTAGVTRGAYLHHFGSREQLIADALGYMLDNLMGTLERRIVELLREGRRDEIIEEIWRAGAKDWIYAGFEMLLRSRLDPVLQRHWAAHSARYGAWRRRVFSEILGDEVDEHSEMQCLLDGILDLLRGQAMMSAVRTQAATREQMEFWRDVLDRELTRILDRRRARTTRKTDKA